LNSKKKQRGKAMIPPAYRQIILEMANKDVSIREIGRILKISRNTVRNVIKKGEEPAPAKESKYLQHLPLIKELFRECRGNAVRIQEELLSRHGVTIPYQSLTWIILCKVKYYVKLNAEFL